MSLQLGEISCYVQNKRQKGWIGIGLDVETPEIVGFVLGDRSEKTAQKLSETLPKVYWQSAVCYTDFGSAYQEVLPSKRHKAVNKSSGKISYIERLNNTLRKRVSQLVRKTLSFSKKIENHLDNLVSAFRLTSFFVIMLSMNFKLENGIK